MVLMKIIAGALKGNNENSKSRNGFAGEVCRQFLEDKETDTIYWPPCLPDLNPVENLWDIMIRCLSDAAGLDVRLSRSSVMT